MAARAWRRLMRAEARFVGDGVTVAGVDEAGRGPLAGPVVAAAVVLGDGKRWDGLNDSKQIPHERREELYARVTQEARAFAWAVVGPRTIDRIDIRKSAHLAMARAVRRLRVPPEVVLVDGHECPAGIACRQHAVIDGDATMLSIAAASIVAKVVRDRIMRRFDAFWPQYGFAQHKGYGTPEHLAAIAAHGPCPLHRWSFAPVREIELPLFETAVPAVD